MIILLLLLTPIILMLTLQSKENFTTPVSHTVPAMNHTKGLPFFVGNKKPFVNQQIVPKSGTYTFRKPVLTYDGVFEEKCHLQDKFQTCNWNDVPDKVLTYGTNHFFNTSKKFKDGLYSPPECDWNTMMNNSISYKQNYNKNKPYFLQKPSKEDILGYPKQDNNVYFF